MNDQTKQLLEPDKRQVHQQLRIYSHSSFFYWWPVWVVGYLMTFLTYSHGKPDQIEAIGQAPEWFHPSNNEVVGLSG